MGSSPALLRTGEPAAAGGLRGKRRSAPAPADSLPIYLRDMCATALLDPEGETELFARLARARADLLALERHLPSAFRPGVPEADDEGDGAPGEPLDHAERVHDALENWLRQRPDRADAELLLRARGLRTRIDSAKEALVLANLRLVVHMARRFAGNGVALLDLIQEGNIGLMKAIDRFDHERGNKLSTYAHWWIKQAMVRSLADKSRLIRLPVHLHERRRKLSQIEGQLSQSLGRRPRTAELARKLHCSLGAIERLLDTVSDPVPLEDAGDDERSAAPLRTLEDRGAVSPWLQLARRDLSAKVDRILGSLPPREERVLRLRFGIGNDEAYTLDQIGEMIQVSRERVRQIQATALRRLRESRALDDFRRFAGAI